MNKLEQHPSKSKWFNSASGKAFLMGFVMSIGCKLSSPITDYYEPIAYQQFRDNPNSSTEFRYMITLFLPFLIVSLVLLIVDLILKRFGFIGFEYFTKKGPYKISSFFMFLFGFFAYILISTVITVMFKYI